MSKNILIINGKSTFAHTKGTLNQSLVDIATQTIQGANLNVKSTTIENSYDSQEEIDKYLWADVVIYQTPVWWMGLPWVVKKYLDEVLTSGHSKLYKHDGREIDDPSKKYGTGGLIGNKKYMLSLTWNAPAEAFEDKGQFFEGLGVDMVFFNVHKAHEFLGMTRIPTFMCNDVMKNPKIENDIENYIKHLEEHIINC